MDGHLVPVEVSVEAFTRQRVQVNRVAFYQRRLEGLDAHAVKRRSTVEHDRVVADDLLEDIPDLFVLPFEHFLGAFDRVSVTKFFKLADDERLEQLQRDFLWQTTLV